MPRIIFKCPHLKGRSDTAHIENLVNYIATRKGVEYISQSQSDEPATPKQIAMVKRLLHDFPLSRGLFEYEDYEAVPTMGNASEFISRAIEDNLDQLAKRKNYLDYVAKRPRAQRIGAHGLFTGDEDTLVLSQVADTVAHHPGTVWLPIISLRREDAARLGYDSAERWQELLSAYAPEIASGMKIPLESFRWYAAYHDEGHHPHVHMVCYSTDPKKGFLSKDGIAKIKSGLVKDIFRQELTELYAQQTQRRNDLTQEARAALAELVAQMQGDVLDNPRLEQLMAHLSQRLSGLNGKKQYGYLKADLKNVVDEIVDELARDSRVAEAYRIWYGLREDVLHTYKDELPSRVPLSQQQEFKQIKNAVIAEAVRLGELEPIQMAETPPEALVVIEESLPNDEPKQKTQIATPSPAGAPAPYVAWSRQYKQARQFFYGSDGNVPDFQRAFHLFLAEAQDGNALAMHDMGRIFADGLSPAGAELPPDTEEGPVASHWWYAEALSTFLTLERQDPGKYVEYRIGKMYAAGLGTEQDYSQAARWFQKSAKKEYRFAQYSLGNLYYHGNGVEQDFVRTHNLYTAAAKQGVPYAAFELGKMYRDGIGCDKDEIKSAGCFTQAFQGFRALEQQSHDDKLQYRLGWMLLNGVGTLTDEAQAKDYFERAARVGNQFAQYQLAKLVLGSGSPTLTQIVTAVGWLTKSAENGNQFAQYLLGKLYLRGEHVQKDKVAARRWLTAAAEQGNEYAQYAIDRINDPMWTILSATRLLRALGELFQEQVSAPRTLSMVAGVDSKLLQKIREKKIAMGHKPDDHAPTLSQY